jgi:hypothetical protein
VIIIIIVVVPFLVLFFSFLTKILNENLVQCLFLHYKSHVNCPGIEAVKGW